MHVAGTIVHGAQTPNRKPQTLGQTEKGLQQKSKPCNPTISNPEAKEAITDKVAEARRAVEDKQRQQEASTCHFGVSGFSNFGV